MSDLKWMWQQGRLMELKALVACLTTELIDTVVPECIAGYKSFF